MRLAAGLAAACLLTAVGTAPAFAKPGKVCNLISDAGGDARPNEPVPSDDSLDIVSGDFASNGRKITGIIRVKALQLVNPRAPIGQVYVVAFRVVGVTTPLTLTATVTPTGNQFHFGYQEHEPTTGAITSYPIGVTTGSVIGNEIRVSVEIKRFPAAAVPRLANGKRVTWLVADARALAGQRAVAAQDVGTLRAPLAGVTVNVDSALGTRYLLGTRSCVVIG